MQILQDCLHSNEMLAIYLLEFGTDMPSNITKKDLISIIFKISRRKDLISVIMFLCQKLDWIATKEDGVLTKEIQESDKKLEENTSEDNGLDASKISPDESFTSIKSGQCSSKILAKDHETENYQQSLTTKISGTTSSFNQNSDEMETMETNSASEISTEVTSEIMPQTSKAGNVAKEMNDKNGHLARAEAIRKYNKDLSLKMSLKRYQCKSPVVANTREELMNLNLMKHLRPEALAHCIINASKKSKMDVVTELLDHYQKDHKEYMAEAQKETLPTSSLTSQAWLLTHLSFVCCL